MYRLIQNNRFEVAIFEEYQDPRDRLDTCNDFAKAEEIEENILPDSGIYDNRLLPRDRDGKVIRLD